MAQRRTWHDSAGVGCSAFCLAHCLALPLVAAGLPILAPWTEAEWLHLAILPIAAPLAVLSLFRPVGGSSISPLLWAAGALGLLLLLVGALHPDQHDVTVTVAGALVLGLAHTSAWLRRRKSCDRSCA